MDLSSSQLDGAIPTELGDLTALESLNVISNLLSGGIPAELGTLASLESLFLGSNLLSGEIPDQILDLQDTVLSLILGGNGCLETDNPTLEAWLTSLDPTWNEGCLFAGG